MRNRRDGQNGNVNIVHTGNSATKVAADTEISSLNKRLER